MLLLLAVTPDHCSKPRPTIRYVLPGRTPQRDGTTLRSAPSVQESSDTYAFRISWRSHASTILKSRRAVTGETASVCAISSVESPPK